MDFSDVVIAQIKNPLDVLCADLMKAGELDQYLFFNGVSEMIGDASDEGGYDGLYRARSLCLGFTFTPDVELQVTRILDHAIDLSSIMSVIRCNERANAQLKRACAFSGLALSLPPVLSMC